MSLKFITYNGLLASGDETGEIVLWNITLPGRGFRAYTLYGHKSFVFDMTLTNENILASSSYDQTIKIWNLTSSSILHTLTGHNGSVFTLKSLGHSELASGRVYKTIKVWDVTSGKLISTLLGHTNSVTSLDVYHDSNMLVSVGFNEKMVRFWHISTEKQIHTLNTTLNGWSLELV